MPPSCRTIVYVRWFLPGLVLVGLICCTLQNPALGLAPPTLVPVSPSLLQTQQQRHRTTHPVCLDRSHPQQVRLPFILRHQSSASASASSSPSLSSLSMVGDARGDYYGESSGSYMVKGFSQYEELDEIVQLAGQSLPERPDGIVCVAKYTSMTRQECKATEAEYERLARANPATIFLRCFEEYDNAQLLMGQADVQTWPTYDVFYGGNRVARVQGGGNLAELEDVLQMYQFQNSDLDLFSEDASRKRQLRWGDGTAKDMTRTPRTTARFVPGYDWNTNKGFFDEQGEKAQRSFEEIFENWVPNLDDDKDDGGSGGRSGSK